MSRGSKKSFQGGVFWAQGLQIEEVANEQTIDHTPLTGTT